ncbi:MAG: hypothetical protein CMJ31_02565 [Phycisphaerae bacterium]|nr:hypothetical protein [Phycisphaerae bacterium]
MSGSDERTERRLQRIEESLGFTEMTTQELTEQGLTLHKRLDELERRVGAIERRLNAVVEEMTSGDEEEP